MDGAPSRNMRRLAHDTLLGHAGVGGGMSMQIARDGRRIMWLAHEGPPKNFTGVDVSDPRKPKVICETDLPRNRMRSNSLERVGDMVAVTDQSSGHGET